MLNLYFNPAGRIPRWVWWVHCIIIRNVASVFVVFAAAFIIYTAVELGFLDRKQGDSWTTLVVFGVIAISVWSGIAMSVKRLHDMEMSAWWLLIVLFPFLGGLVLLALLGFPAGTPGPNRYDADDDASADTERSPLDGR